MADLSPKAIRAAQMSRYESSLAEVRKVVEMCVTDNIIRDGIIETTCALPSDAVVLPSDVLSDFLATLEQEYVDAGWYYAEISKMQISGHNVNTIKVRLVENEEDDDEEDDDEEDDEEDDDKYGDAGSDESVPQGGHPYRGGPASVGAPPAPPTPPAESARSSTGVQRTLSNTALGLSLISFIVSLFVLWYRLTH